MTDTIRYAPPPSLAGFLRSEAFISLITGPVGSGKSSAAMMKILVHAKRMRPQADGIRRARAVVVRNTRQMLTDATLPTFMTWIKNGVVGAYAKTDTRFDIRYDDVECDVMFRGLDDANDVRRLLSVEASFGVLDEFREIHPDIFDTLQARLGRYPSVAQGGCVTDTGAANHHLWGASNAPDTDTFWENYLTNPPSAAAIFRQPSALAPEADWLAYLPKNYYQTIAERKSEDWVRVYIHNEFGRSLSGQPVFRTFDRTVHVAATVPATLNKKLVLGMDAGLNPTIVVTQQTYDGRVVVHDAITGNEDGMGALRFCREKLKPLLTEKYARAPCAVVIDPAAFQRAQTDERSVADIVRAEGFDVEPAATNAVAARLAVVEKYLTRTVNGHAGLLVSPQAPLLIQALAGKYRYKINTKGLMGDAPAKEHPWSDVADALQYACLYHDGGATFGATSSGLLRPVEPVQYAWV